MHLDEVEHHWPNTNSHKKKKKKKKNKKKAQFPPLFKNAEKNFKIGDTFINYNIGQNLETIFRTRTYTKFAK